jgi:hypothetical protein
MNETLEWIKTFILTMLGHAFTGAATAFIYEIGRLVSAGVTDWSVLVTGALIGASLAFFKVIVSEIEKMLVAPEPIPNLPPTFSNVKRNKGKIPEPPAFSMPPAKKKFRSYLGI